MLGNVSEHCYDVYVADGYGDRLEIDPTGPPELPNCMYVVRGGNYESPLAELRAASRTGMGSNLWDTRSGVRIACDVIGNLPPAFMLREPPPFVLTPDAAAVPVGER
jgi:hypothetical protein